LFLLFTIVPLVELVILFRISSVVGWGYTIVLVIVTGALGAALARYQGMMTWRRIQSDLSMGIVPSGRLIDGALILISGLLLVTPGILTDLVGFSLLVPALRDRIKRRLRDWFRRKVEESNIHVQVGPFQ